MSPPSQSAFFDFRQATQKLAMQSEAQQIHILKFELYCALERAAAFQTQKASLEQEVHSLKADVEHASQTLRVANATRDREVQELRDQVRSLEEQGAALEHLCQSLLDTVEVDGSAAKRETPTLPPLESATA